MKKLLVISLLSLSIPYLVAAEKDVSAADLSVPDRLESFSPSIKVKTKTSAKQLPINQDASVSMTLRSELKKDRTDALANSKTSKVIKFRAESAPKSAKSGANALGFSIYSADTFLNVDFDGDGYYSVFTIEFDADFDQAEYRDVYGVIYYSQNGAPWALFSTTEIFTIFSNDSNDFYSATFTLDSDFQADEYDFLIDLYEDGFSDRVATFGPDDGTNQLYALPLEDEAHEVAITYVATDLSGDADADGFYTDLTLEYDIDSALVGETVYAEMVITSLSAGWQQVLSSDDYILGTQTEFVDLTFNSGYPAGRYDIQINIVNSSTGEVIADAGQEYASLNSLPIESINNDTPVHVDVVVHDGGSFGWSVVFLGLLAMRRRQES